MARMEYFLFYVVMGSHGQRVTHLRKMAEESVRNAAWAQMIEPVIDIPTMGILVFPNTFKMRERIEWITQELPEKND